MWTCIHMIITAAHTDVHWTHTSYTHLKGNHSQLWFFGAGNKQQNVHICNQHTWIITWGRHVTSLFPSSSHSPDPGEMVFLGRGCILEAELNLSISHIRDQFTLGLKYSLTIIQKGMTFGKQYYYSRLTFLFGNIKYLAGLLWWWQKEGADLKPRMTTVLFGTKTLQVFIPCLFTNTVPPFELQ